MNQQKVVYYTSVAQKINTRKTQFYQNTQQLILMSRNYNTRCRVSSVEVEVRSGKGKTRAELELAKVLPRSSLSCGDLEVGEVAAVAHAVGRHEGWGDHGRRVVVVEEAPAAPAQRRHVGGVLRGAPGAAPLTRG